MSTPLLEALDTQTELDMQTENEETGDRDETKAAAAAAAGSDAAVSPVEETDSNESAPNELELPQWSIVTFEGVAVRGLSYNEALKWMEKLRAQNISGLCIVTDEAAARISEK